MDFAFGEEYQNNEFLFKIEVPDDWRESEGETLSKSPVDQNIIKIPVNFFKDAESGGWDAVLQIRYIDSEFYKKYQTNEEAIEILKNLIEIDCNSYKILWDGLSCEGVEIIETKIFKVHENTVFQIKYFWNERDFTGNKNNSTSIGRIVSAENGLWYIFSEAYTEKFPNFENEILKSMDSFQILKSGQTVENIEPVLDLENIRLEIEALNKKGDEMWEGNKTGKAIEFYKKALTLDGGGGTVQQILIKDSKYIVKTTAELRTSSGELVSVRQGTGIYYLPHRITDNFLDEQPVEKIVEINGEKYELRILKTNEVIKLAQDEMHFYVGTTFDVYNFPLFTTGMANIFGVENEFVSTHWEIYRLINN